jgi:hypothetical protein
VPQLRQVLSRAVFWLSAVPPWAPLRALPSARPRAPAWVPLRDLRGLRPSILVVVNVAVPNCFPHVPHLEPYSYHRSLLDIVGLGEDRTPTAGTDVPDNSLDPAVTMVLVPERRVASPVKVVISIDSATGTSVPTWAAAAVGGTTAVRALARSATDASAPVWVAATVPLGCATAHCIATLALPPSPA